MEYAPHNDDINKFNDYFVSNWLDNNSIPKNMWYERHRTTNLVESWHKKLNSKLHKNPRLLEFLFIIWEEANKVL